MMVYRFVSNELFFRPYLRVRRQVGGERNGGARRYSAAPLRRDITATRRLMRDVRWNSTCVCFRRMSRFKYYDCRDVYRFDEVVCLLLSLSD